MSSKVKHLFLLSVLVFGLVSCGEEAFKEVSDSSDKQTALKEAQNKVAKEPDYVSLSTEFSYSSGVRSFSGVKSIKISDGTFGAYAKVYVDSKNYFTNYVAYSKSERKYYQCFQGMSTTSAATYSYNFKTDVTSLFSGYESLGSSEIKDYLKSSSFFFKISSLTADDVSIYEGSQGSYKIVSNVDQSTYITNTEIIIDKNGHFSSLTLNSTNSSSASSDENSYTETYKYEYGKDVPVPEFDSFKDPIDFSAATCIGMSEVIISTISSMFFLIN
jgi:hypothetical protein